MKKQLSEVKNGEKFTYSGIEFVRRTSFLIDETGEELVSVNVVGREEVLHISSIVSVDSDNSQD